MEFSFRGKLNVFIKKNDESILGSLNFERQNNNFLKKIVYLFPILNVTIIKNPKL